MIAQGTPVEETNIPRQARYHGKIIRILEYLGHDMFLILDSDDSRRKVHRAQLTFIKGKSA